MRKVSKATVNVNRNIIFENCEVESAKYKLLMSDIHVPHNSMNILNSAGRKLMEAKRGSEDAGVTQSTLNKLNNMWYPLHDKAANRQQDVTETFNAA